MLVSLAIQGSKIRASERARSKYLIDIRKYQRWTVSLADMSSPSTPSKASKKPPVFPVGPAAQRLLVSY